MKKVILIFLLGPMVAFASEMSTEETFEGEDVNTPIFSSDAITAEPMLARCGGQSDIYCYGRSPGAICRNPRNRGSLSTCRGTGSVGGSRETVCFCF